MHDQLIFRGISDTPVQAASRSAPSAAQTLLKELVRERHLTYEAFNADYKKAASEVTADGTAPSRAQYYRWLSGQLKRGMPYPGACRVLEAMFAPWRAADLFGPYQPGCHAPHPLERAVSDHAAFGQFTAQQPVASRGPGTDGTGGQAIPLGIHPRYAADFGALASGQVAAARTALGLSLGEFAALLANAVGWNVTAEAVGRWETESAPPGDVVLFVQAYFGGSAVGGWGGGSR